MEIKKYTIINMQPNCYFSDCKIEEYFIVEIKCFVCYYSGPCILRPPIQIEKHGDVLN